MLLWGFNCFSWESPANTQIQPLWSRLTDELFFKFPGDSWWLSKTHSNTSYLGQSRSSLRQASPIFKENPSSQQHPSGLLQSLYSWRGGGRKWHKYLSFNNRKNKNKRNTGRKWNKRSWWQSWCWASNARWVIINTKEKILDSIPHNCHK